METRDILKKLREEHALSQDDLAQRVMVTRQAVSRWENGETQPNTEKHNQCSQSQTLKTVLIRTQIG